jgi:hypothetical protein
MILRFVSRNQSFRPFGKSLNEENLILNMIHECMKTMVHKQIYDDVALEFSI